MDAIKDAAVQLNVPMPFLLAIVVPIVGACRPARPLLWGVPGAGGWPAGAAPPSSLLQPPFAPLDASLFSLLAR